MTKELPWEFGVESSLGIKAILRAAIATMEALRLIAEKAPMQHLAVPPIQARLLSRIRSASAVGSEICSQKGMRDVGTEINFNPAVHRTPAIMKTA